MQVGFARADITPPIGREVPGSLGKVYSTNIHDPLWATACVVDDGTTRVALVGVDTLSIRGRTVRAAREMIEKVCGIPGENVMIGCSHTHNGGPSGWALPGEFADSFDPELCEFLSQEKSTAGDAVYLKELAEQIATAVILADKRKQDALLAFGKGEEHTVAWNRRFNMKNGTQMTHPGKGNPDIVDWAGPVDPEVGVLSAWTMEREFIGAIVNFTLHGTVFSGGISADWPFWMRETIKSALNPDAHIVFLNGACGDITQVNNMSLQDSEFGEKWATRIGCKVGAEAVKVIADAEPGETGPVAAIHKNIAIQTREVSEERFQKALELIKSGDMDSWDGIFARDEILLHEQNKIEPLVETEVLAIQIGPAAYVSNPAEYFCQFGLNIKQRSAFPYTWVVELANGCIGYVPVPEALGPHGGGYEPRLAMSSKLVPEAGQMIEDTSVELLDSLTPGAEPPRPQIEQTQVPWTIND